MNKWDAYFHSHYKPKQKAWGERDLSHYKNWYFAWISYIDAKLPFKKFLPKNAHILEVGSGIGGVSALLAERGFHVTGSDISREMVKVAGKTNKRIAFIYCDIQKKIPGKYDAIFGFEVLEHIPDSSRAVQNIKDSLKKGGYFIGSTPYPYPKAYLDPTHCSVHYPEKWRKIFKQAHFESIQIYPMSLIPYLWRLHKRLQIVLPFYFAFPAFVSTTLIIAKK